MKIGFQTCRYNSLSLFEELQLFETSQIDCFDLFFDECLPSDLSEQTLKKLLELQKEKFLFSVHFPIDYPYLSEHSKKELVEFTRNFTPLTTTIHFDNISFSFLEKLYSEIGSFTKLSIENTIPDRNKQENLNYLSFLEKTIKLGKFYATFDIGHCHVNGYSINKYIQLILETGIAISTIHVHDNNGTLDSHSVMGSGTVDFSSLLKTLKQKEEPLFIIEHWENNLLSLKKLRQLNEKKVP